MPAKSIRTAPAKSTQPKPQAGGRSVREQDDARSFAEWVVNRRIGALRELAKH